MKFLRTSQLLFFTLALLLSSTNAHAYIGPGLGAGVIAIVLGFLVGFLMLLVGVVWYPLKKLIKKIKQGRHD